MTALVVLAAVFVAVIGCALLKPDTIAEIELIC